MPFMCARPAHNQDFGISYCSGYLSCSETLCTPFLYLGINRLLGNLLHQERRHLFSQPLLHLG